MFGCVGGELHKDSSLAAARPANVADSLNGLGQCWGRRASAWGCSIQLVAHIAYEVSRPSVRCDVWHTMKDYVVGPDTLAEGLQARAFCVDLLPKLVLDCSFPGNAVACQ